MSFAKNKLVHLNLHIIAFHIFPRFSCLNVMYLMIKSKKQKFHTCEKVTSQTAHFFSHARHFIFVNFHENLIKIWWKLYFAFQIQAELCFCSLTVMLEKLTYLSHSCKGWSSSRLKLETVHFFFVFWKTNFPNFFWLKAVFSAFSCLSLTYLMIKFQKRKIHICEMVHN